MIPFGLLNSTILPFSFPIRALASGLDIDNLFSSKINNYTPLLKVSHNEYYITLKRNNTVDHIMQEYKNSLQLPINIFFIKKCASQCYPIVYIL